MLVTSIFSFSHNVFKRFLPWGCKKSGLCGKALILVGKKMHPIFFFLNTAFSPFPKMFSNLFNKTFNYLNYLHFVICKCFQFGQVYSFVVCYRVNPLPTMLHFDALKIHSCGKHCEKRRNCLQQAIYPFLTMFSTLYGTFFPF